MTKFRRLNPKRQTIRGNWGGRLSEYHCKEQGALFFKIAKNKKNSFIQPCQPELFCKFILFFRLFPINILKLKIQIFPCIAVVLSQWFFPLGRFKTLPVPVLPWYSGHQVCLRFFFWVISVPFKQCCRSYPFWRLRLQTFQFWRLRFRLQLQLRFRLQLQLQLQQKSVKKICNL